METIIKNRVGSFAPKRNVSEQDFENSISNNKKTQNTLPQKVNIQITNEDKKEASVKKGSEKEDIEDNKKENSLPIIENKTDTQPAQTKESSAPIYPYTMKEEKYVVVEKKKKEKTRGVSNPPVDNNNNNNINDVKSDEKNVELTKRQFKIKNINEDIIVELTNKQIYKIQTLLSDKGHTIKFVDLLKISKRLGITIIEDSGNGDKRHITFNGRSSLWWKTRSTEIGHELHRLVRSDFENKFGLKKEIFDK